MNRIEATLSRRMAEATKARQNAFRENHQGPEKSAAWCRAYRRCTALRLALRALRGLDNSETNETPILL